MKAPKRINEQERMQTAAWKTYEEFIPTRQSLLSRLRDWNDHEGWKLFFDTYWRLIYSAARKSGLSDTEAQDVVQETVISVLKSIPTFKYDKSKGSFKGWLLKLTKWRVLDHLRKVKSHSALFEVQSSVTGGAEQIDDIADPAVEKIEAGWDKEWDQNLISAAIERVKKKVDSKQYQIFDLYVFKEWPVSQVAKTMGTSVGKVYLIKHRLSKLIKKEVEHLKNSPL